MRRNFLYYLKILYSSISALIIDAYQFHFHNFSIFQFSFNSVCSFLYYEYTKCAFLCFNVCNFRGNFIVNTFKYKALNSTLHDSKLVYFVFTFRKIFRFIISSVTCNLISIFVQITSLIYTG